MVLVHDDESQHEVGDGFDDLTEACRAAFRAAEDCSRRDTGSPSPPRWISIYRDEALELSVQVTGPAPAAAGFHSAV